MLTSMLESLILEVLICHPQNQQFVEMSPSPLKLHPGSVTSLVKRFKDFQQWFSTCELPPLWVMKPSPWAEPPFSNERK